MTDSSSPVGVICAIPEEIDQFGSDFRQTTGERVGGYDFVTGLLEGVPAVLVEGGMGKVNAGLVATLLADRFACRALLFSGVAGGIDAELGIGDVVVSERLIQHDYGVMANQVVEAYQPGHLPFFMPTDRLGYEPPPPLLSKAREALEAVDLPDLSPEAVGGSPRKPRIRFGTILTGDSFMSCRETRERLYARFGAQAIEMEGAAVSQVAERFGLPCLVIRALSDMAGEDNNMDFLAFLHETAACSALVLRRLLPVI